MADRVDLLTTDMTSLPFPDNTFDLVLSNVAICNVKSAARDATIAEALRVLRPGGLLFLVAWQTAARAICVPERRERPGLGPRTA